MDSEVDATSCSVCQEIYSEPRSLPCGHSYCLECSRLVAGNMQEFPCPICGFKVDHRDGNVDELPTNLDFSNVIEDKDKTLPSTCLDHKKSLDLFCEVCDMVICSKCLSMQHKDHAIEDIDKIFSERNEHLAAFLDSTMVWASKLKEKKDLVEQSGKSMVSNIDSITKTVQNTFKKWHDSLQRQQNAIMSYLHQEINQKRQVFHDASRVFKSALTTVTELDTEISKLRIKAKSFVVQQYGSIKARKEDTESKILKDIGTSFTPPDNLVIEVYAPWIEEAIDNIKPIDMKQTQAGPKPQKIAKIQEENIILKRECEKLRNTLEELEKRKSNEVENLKYWKQCLDTLVQYVHDHVVSGAKSAPRTITQPPEVEPESSLAKRYQHAQEICAQFTKVENDNKELKDKNLGQVILMATLEEYVTSKKQNISLDIPTDIQLDQRFVSEHGQAKRIAQEFEEKKRDLSSSKQELATKTKEYEQNYEKLRADHEKLKTDYANLQGRFKEPNAHKSKLEDDNTKLQRKISYLEKEKADMDVQHKMEIENQKQEIAMLKQEKETLLTRLSKIAGDRLTHHNANIADLRDPDRPIKLSEIYSELYDNEWTDAFEELTEETSLSDEAAIKFLLDILMNAFRKCKKITWNRYESLKLIATTLDFKQENVTSKITTDSQVEEEETWREGTSEKKDCSLPAVSEGLSIKAMCDNDTQTNETSSEGTSEKKDCSLPAVSEGLSIKVMCDNDTQTNEASSNGTVKEKEYGLLEMSKGYSIKNYTNKDTQTNQTTIACKLDGKDCCSNAMSERVSIKDKMNAYTQTDENTFKNVQTKTTSLSSTLSIDQEKSLKNIWRATSSSLKDDSLKMLHAELSTSLCKPETEMPKTYKYLKVCTDLSWKMGVQVKPMHLDIIAEKQVGQEKQFDTDKFRAYTKAGTSVAYVVWPALFLHEGGVMLVKGIAQGCQKVLNV